MHDVPGKFTLNNIMKNIFHLKYSRLNKANTKYRDPTYNEKRQWVSRLLTQFMSEDAIIISVDESNFRSDAFPPKQWQFDERLNHRSKSKQHPKKTLNTILADDKTIIQQPTNNKDYIN